MPAENTAIPPDQLIDEIRRAVRDHVIGTSLRNMARQLNFSPSGLSKFLDGAQPYRKSFLRLQAWYSRNQHEPVQLSDEDAAAAIAVLTAGMERDRRAAAMQSVVEALTTGFADNPPQWLLNVREHRLNAGESAAA
jgi:hypothetical protein